MIPARLMPLALYTLIGLFFAGVLLTIWAPAYPSLEPWAVTTLTPAAGFGAIMAIRMLFTMREMHEAAHLPHKMHVDMEHRVAFVTSFDGEMSTIELPEEIVEQGPDAITEYVLYTVDPDLFEDEP